jgi:glutathione peroxidase
MATMTLRQRGIKWVYPLIMKFTGKNKKAMLNTQNSKPAQSFYSLKIQLNNGSFFSMDGLRGKKVLLVNTASDCGFTPQYADLQKLYESYKEKITVIGFPANDFKEQEKGSDEEISQFCKVNFGVSFPLAKKAVVVKSENQHEVYQWLTHKEKNGWNDLQPVWNFCKYLVNEEGVLTHYFDMSVSPLDPQITEAVVNK